MATFLGGFALELSDKSRIARLHMINLYALSWVRSHPDGSLVVCGLGVPWEIFHGAIEALRTLGRLYLEELPWDNT